MLKNFVKVRNNACCDVIDPDLHSSLLIWIFGEKRSLVWKGFIQILRDQVRFNQGLLRSVFLWRAQCWNQPARIQLQETLDKSGYPILPRLEITYTPLFFQVRIDLNIFIGYLFLFQGDPRPLHKRTKPARVKCDELVLLMLSYDVGRLAGRAWVNVRIRNRHHDQRKYDIWEEVLGNEYTRVLSPLLPNNEKQLSC